MAKKKVKVSKKVSVGDDDVGASVETHAGASAEVTDSSVSAEAEVGAGVEAHAGTTEGGHEFNGWTNVNKWMCEHGYAVGYWGQNKADVADEHIVNRKVLAESGEQELLT